MIYKNKQNLFFVGLIILFAIIPSNNYLPNLWQTINALMILTQEYSLFANLLFTLSVVLLSLLAAFLVSVSVTPFFNVENKSGNNIAKFFKKLGSLMPPFLFGVYLILIAPTSPFINILFGMIVASALQTLFISKAVRKIPNHFIETVSTFGSDKKKSVQIFLRSLSLPLSFSFMKKLNRIIWIYLLVFEFIKNFGSGIGTIIRLAFEYWNVPMLFAASISITFTIFLTDVTISFLSKRFFIEDQEELFK